MTAATDCHETVIIVTLEIRARFRAPNPNSPGFRTSRGCFCLWLRLRDMDSLAVHTLAYAAYGILRDLCCGRPEVMEMVNAIIDHTDFAKIPSFLKHADHDQEGMLNAHSPETTHLTVELAIRLWRELGRDENARDARLLAAT